MAETDQSRAQCVLILGGTPEALALTEAAAQTPGIAPILSLAGRTPTPRLPGAGRVRTGGFGGAEGLRTFLSAERVRAVIDATHPYAAGMAQQAAQASDRLDLPRLRLERPPWSAQPGDAWISVSSMQGAAAHIGARAERVFLSSGHLGLDRFAACTRAWFLIRAIVPPRPEVVLPAQRTLLLARGPFDRADEEALMETHRISLLVSKNGGGIGTYAKIAAARRRGVPVLMLARPERPDGPVVFEVSAALAWLRRAVA